MSCSSGPLARALQRRKQQTHCHRCFCEMEHMIWLPGWMRAILCSTVTVLLPIMQPRLAADGCFYMHGPWDES